MRIYIPTKGRGPDLQLTYDRILPAIIDTPFTMFLVCPEEECGTLDHKYPTIGCPATRIGATRQWIVDNSTDDKVLMLDDDLLRWAVRRDPAVGKYSPANYADITETLYRVEELLSSYAHVGVGARLFANIFGPEVINGRITRAWGLRADIIRQHHLKFTCPVDDLEMTLQLLRAGYANSVIYTTVQDQEMSQSPGGASTYRTLEYHNACHEQINRWHPQFTTLVEKNPQKGWFDGKPRKEVKISWRSLTNACHPTTIQDRTGPVPAVTRNSP